MTFIEWESQNFIRFNVHTICSSSSDHFNQLLLDFVFVRVNKIKSNIPHFKIFPISSSLNCIVSHLQWNFLFYRYFFLLFLNSMVNNWQKNYYSNFRNDSFCAWFQLKCGTDVIWEHFLYRYCCMLRMHEMFQVQIKVLKMIEAIKITLGYLDHLHFVHSFRQL